MRILLVRNCVAAEQLPITHDATNPAIVGHQDEQFLCTHGHNGIESTWTIKTKKLILTVGFTDPAEDRTFCPSTVGVLKLLPAP